MDSLKFKLDKFYTDILETMNIEKFDEHFSPDCQIEINGVVFDEKAFKQRMVWLKENMKKVTVEVLDCFAGSDPSRITDLHLSIAVDREDVEHRVLVMQQSVLDEQGRIKRFFDISRILSADKETEVHIAK